MRRRVAKKHRILPDARFGDTQVTTFVNNLMLDGKKSVAFTIFYNAIDRVSERTGEDGLETFKKALENMHLIYGNPMWRVVRFQYVPSNAENPTPYCSCQE